jgi:hypothetical protein
MTKSIILKAEILPAFDDAAEGKELTTAFKEATSGMRRVLEFGARLWKVREVLSARGQNSPKRGPGSTENSLGNWLKEHAPDVNHSTAYRFLDVTEAIAQDYAQIVGQRVAKQFALCDLVTTPAADLPEDAREKQLSLFDYASGKSQRSWLDRFATPKGRGGDHGGGKGKGKPKSPEQQKAAMRERCNLLGEALQALITDKDYKILERIELDHLEDLLTELNTAVKGWAKKSANERQGLVPTVAV